MNAGTPDRQRVITAWAEERDAAARAIGVNDQSQAWNHLAPESSDAIDAAGYEVAP